jgi:hypothetical protein
MITSPRSMRRAELRCAGTIPFGASIGIERRNVMPTSPPAIR